ncbi:hypothetical protein DPMN_064645 [Dreissena polymorpha]|uniref:Uncharacterized protein n=1 Tax=Dreissena polymorpha TaxID=45954 RepID=A0A9D4HKA1_DREPO|nr:hypothetical protein DPMN_064645 [Dreissena polymorpha]
MIREFEQLVPRHSPHPNEQSSPSFLQEQIFQGRGSCVLIGTKTPSETSQPHSSGWRIAVDVQFCSWKFTRSKWNIAAEDVGDKL